MRVPCLDSRATWRLYDCNCDAGVPARLVGEFGEPPVDIYRSARWGYCSTKYRDELPPDLRDLPWELERDCYLTDADLKDGLTGPELEKKILELTAQTVAKKLREETERLMREKGLTFDEIFGDPEEDTDGEGQLSEGHDPDGTR